MVRLRFWMERPFHQLQLEQAHIFGRGRVRRALQVSRQPLARQDMAALCLPAKAARRHVLDHALAQRRNAGRIHHGELLLE
jgi:hypothetical protein